jgi:toxin ParE1/3/4
MKRVTRSWQADEDLKSSAAYYALSSITTAKRFARAIQDAIDLVSQYPEIGSINYAAPASQQGLRSMVVKRFPYLIFYLDRPEDIFVVRVMHMSNDLPESLRTIDPRPGS